jgi:hypothetical protein
MYVVGFKYHFATKDIVHCCGQATDEYQKVEDQGFNPLLVCALARFRNQSGYSEMEADIIHRKVMMKN